MNIHEIMNKKDDKGNFVLTPLPYTDDHLEPFIGSKTVKYHYYKHLQAYIDKVNALKGEYPADITIEGIIRSARSYSDLYRNASQVFNHYFYFEQLNIKEPSDPLPLTDALICGQYGSVKKFKQLIVDAGMRIFGSGWVFVTKTRNKLWIRPYTETFTPVNETPIMALDVWEHAYYLDTHNNRHGYICNFFDLMDWSVIERRISDESKQEVK